jgi:redox-sensitive bicupin YhaK (pirin superfamily)
MLIEPRTVKLTTRTGVAVHRTLPHRDLKMVGAWCFVDHFGPTPQTDGMVVAAHPHTGLQTATWLIEGAIEHRDSIGTVQLIEPGQLNLMTAGHGIAHSELSLAGPQNLHAVQLWIALPKDSIDTAPEFEHQADLPTVAGEGFTATVLAGEFLGARAATKTFSEMIGAELRFAADATTEIELNPEFEYGFMLAAGQLSVDGQAVSTSGLYFVPPGAESVALEAAAGSIVLMLGGKPFGEKILMWWNFIGRTQADINRARDQWNSGDFGRFPEFSDQIGGRIPAPDLPTVTLQAR